MNLHRADLPDWEKVPPPNRNGWQRLAARTNGVLAPANLISIVGALMAIWGLYRLTRGHILLGVSLILIGRAADILDGMIADLTKTKSPLGEAVDAAIDKIIIFVVAIVLIRQNLVPSNVGIVILLISAYISLLSLYTRWRKRKLHPSLLGKLSTAFAWIALALYLLVNPLWPAAICFGLFLVTSLVAAVGYTKQVYRPKP
jgi:phosphatidylglycerophosphate synthase